MADLTGTITGFVAGDDLEVTRTITNIPTGQALERAWLTIKENADDTDAAAIVQKVITSADVAGTGQITDTGSGDTIGAVRFDLVGADTLLLNPAKPPYFYDIQVRTNLGKIYTPEKGKIKATQGVTTAIT